jgi:hypothetical protein
MQDSTNRQDVPALMRERFDLEPEPATQPTITDVIEGIATALEAAVELAEPKLTAARCLTVQTRLAAMAAGHVTPDELLASLRRLAADWRAA